MPNLVRGSDGAEALIGSVFHDQFHAFDGADTLTGGRGADSLDGGDGDDVLRGGQGSDELYGGFGNDVIFTGGNGYEDFMWGSPGNDTYIISGATEQSYYILHYGSFFDLTGRGDVNGNASVFADDFHAATSVEITIGDDTLSAAKTSDLFEIGDFGGRSLVGTESSTDTLSGLTALAAVRGTRDTSFSVHGADGDNTFTVDRTAGPAIRINPKDGTDTVIGDADTVEIMSVSGIFSSSGLDIGSTIQVSSSVNGQMSGTAVLVNPNTNQTESIDTFSGIDSILGSSGPDMFLGSDGNDVFIPNRGQDAMDGDAGFDMVSYDHSRVVQLTVDLANGFAEKLFLSLGGYASRFEDALANVEGVRGHDENDDKLFGAADGNRLEGLGGDDFMNGRRGPDTLVGGLGDDTMAGGFGRDVFVFSGDDGDDRIRDWQDGRDILRINAPDLEFGDVEIVDFGRHTMVTFGQTTVRLNNVDHALIDASDFDFV